MQLRIIYVGILALVVCFVTLPQVLFLNDKISYCEGNGLVLLDKDCIKMDEMYNSMSVYFIVAVIVGVAGMLFIVAGLIARDSCGV